jgi:hypothetical protein
MRIFISLIILAISLQSYADDFSGLWVWDENNGKHTFSIRTEKEGERLVGSYCAVGMSGSRIDCSPNSSKKFPINFNGSDFEFTTNYSGKVGVAKITLIKEKLHWVIVKQPNGEHYAPKKAILSKQ